jgi:hypothetical protein
MFFAIALSAAVFMLLKYSALAAGQGYCAAVRYFPGVASKSALVLQSCACTDAEKKNRKKIA